MDILYSRGFIGADSSSFKLEKFSSIFDKFILFILKENSFFDIFDVVVMTVSQKQRVYWRFAFGNTLKIRDGAAKIFRFLRRNRRVNNK